MKKWIDSLTLAEKVLWSVSSAAIVLSSAFFGGQGWLTLVTSLIGATSLLLSARGHYLGQALMILFSLLYGVISFGFSYYGEIAHLSGHNHAYGVSFSLVMASPPSSRSADASAGRAPSSVGAVLSATCHRCRYLSVLFSAGPFPHG